MARQRIVSVNMGGNAPTTGSSLNTTATSVDLTGALLDGQGNEIVVTSPNYLPCTLDPNTETAEVIWITALTAGQTSAVTIIRNAEPAAQFGSIAQSHSSGATMAFGALPADVGGGTLLGATYYALGSDSSDTVTGATLAPFDATNLTVSFVAPLSGTVVVRLTGLSTMSGTSGSVEWGLQDHTSHAQVGTLQFIQGEIISIRLSAEIVVTGLTPGTVYQYDWCGSDGVGTDIVYLFSGPTLYGTADMEVYDAAPGGGSPVSYPATLLGECSYTPVSDGTTTVSSGSLTAFDTTNLTVSFTAPPSGRVNVILEGLVYATGTGGSGQWGLLDHTAHTQVSGIAYVCDDSLESAFRVDVTLLVTGLIPGTVYQYDFAGYDSGSTPEILLAAGPLFGPLVMQVMDAGPQVPGVGGDAEWTFVGAGGAPAFQNSWVTSAYDGGGLRFRKTADGMVVVAGAVKSGGAPTVFTLPAGYRPATTSGLVFMTLVQFNSDYTWGFIEVNGSNGDVSIFNSSAVVPNDDGNYLDFTFFAEA